MASVDGLDVISGQAGHENRGYLLHPGKNLVIEGFRKVRKKWRHFAHG